MPPKRTTPTERGDKSRAALLTALSDLLEERPLGEITVAEIAARAGVTRSAFYFYFPTKQAAVVGLLEVIGEAFTTAGGDWYANDTGTAKERLLGAMTTALVIYRTKAPLINALLAAAATDPDTSKLWDQLIDHLSSLVVERLQQERVDGTAPPGPDPTTLIRTLMGAAVYAGAYEGRKVLATGEETPELAETLADIWLQAIYASRHPDHATS